MSIIKAIQSLTIIASSILFISQAQAIKIKGPSTSYVPKTCKNFLVGTAGSWAKTLKQARGKAISKWIHKASSQAGRPYSRWRLASQKRFRCSTHGNGSRCIIHAYPCRPGLFFKQ